MNLLSVIGIFAFVYAIDGAGNAWLWLGIALLALAAFIKVESKATVPVMSLRLFSSSVRWKAYAARALFVGAMMGFNFMISEYMQGVYGFTPLEAGLGFLPATVSTFLAAIEVPHLMGKGATAVYWLSDWHFCSLVSYGFPCSMQKVHI